ncbi:hypothetical protein KUA24_131 [Vibrio phage HNL01]|nr:hypothetical protein KUA24_131 [Vibrio phage HNL01]
MRKRDWFRLFFVISGLIAVFLTNKSEAAVPTNIGDILTADVGSQTCMVYNLYHESRSQSDMANIMILNTVMNRVKSERWPNTICEVIKQRHQYSWLFDGRSDKMHDKAQVKRLTKLVDNYLLNKDTYITISEGVNMYKVTGHKTSWDYSKIEKITVIDDHTFYRHK